VIGWGDVEEGPNGNAFVAGVVLLPGCSLAERAAAVAAMQAELQRAA
jgi:hypothetical protein